MDNKDYNNFKFSKDLLVSDSSRLLTYEVSVMTVNYENSSWKYVLISMAAYALQPIALPIMILLSKVLKRQIKWFPINTKPKK